MITYHVGLIVNAAAVAPRYAILTLA